MSQQSLFGEQKRLEKLSMLGDDLEKLNAVIDWEMFRPILNKALKKDRKSNAGRPAYDPILMFKIIVLQREYNLSDDRTEFQIYNCRTFTRFLGLGEADNIPDAKTIWLFKETLARTQAMEEIFKKFNRSLEEKGVIEHSGTIIDATFADAPRQRNNNDENDRIKDGDIPSDWKSKPNKLAQKDLDARWAKKGGETHYGYKDHTKVDMKSKLITKYKTTPANVHDSNVFEEFIDETDKEIYADSAYAGKLVPEYAKNKILEKGYRNKPLTDAQKQRNKENSRKRARIEHVYGDITNGMKGLTLRCIGIVRAQYNIGQTNLVYNFRRYSYLVRQGLAAV